jgi:hypothetical protein
MTVHILVRLSGIFVLFVYRGDNPCVLTTCTARMCLALTGLFGLEWRRKDHARSVHQNPKGRGGGGRCPPISKLRSELHVLCRITNRHFETILNHPLFSLP